MCCNMFGLLQVFVKIPFHSRWTPRVKHWTWTSSFRLCSRQEHRWIRCHGRTEQRYALRSDKHEWAAARGGEQERFTLWMISSNLLLHHPCEPDWHLRSQEQPQKCLWVFCPVCIRLSCTAVVLSSTDRVPELYRCAVVSKTAVVRLMVRKQEGRK